MKYFKPMLTRYLIKNPNTHTRFLNTKFDYVIHKVDDIIDKKINESNDNKIKHVDKLMTKISPYTKNSSNETIVKVDSSLSGLYNKFKIFIKQYGALGLATYWFTWSAFTLSSYYLFKYSVIDYHSWTWLHLESFEHKFRHTIKNWFDKDIVMDKYYEDIVATILMGKITKPIQWVSVYYTTPMIAKLIKGENKEKLM